ncbi:hypothetical protein [Candidatus Pelagadaptatus aseana]|uniref:hypothetical protein n=1 Tax=Candidatus Pelagadaptatus aseana TaxID=3120508 RepID=UPI003C6F41A2
MTSELLGISGILFSGILVFFFSAKYPEYSRALFAAYSLRVLTICFNEFIAPLPDSRGDAINFEEYAWQLSKDGLENILLQFNGPSSYFLSWLVSIIYYFTDRSPLLIQSISLTFGMASVLSGALLSKELWGRRTSKKVVWALAIFPSLILYSVLILREAYIIFFLLCAIRYMVTWIRSGSPRSIIFGVTSFVAAGFFHGAMFLGVFIFAGLILLKLVKNSYRARGKTKLISFATLIVCSIFFLTSLNLLKSEKIPKLGSLDKLLNIERVLFVIQSKSGKNEGGADYPDWVTPKKPIEILYLSPIRISYYLFSPFIWDIKKSSHLIGMIDGFLYFFLTILIWKSRSYIWSNPAAKSILFSTLIFIIIFSFGSGNFGTGIRHRAKLAILIIILAGPALPAIKRRVGYLPDTNPQ